MSNESEETGQSGALRQSGRAIGRGTMVSNTQAFGLINGIFNLDKNYATFS